MQTPKTLSAVHGDWRWYNQYMTDLAGARDILSSGRSDIGFPYVTTELQCDKLLVGY